ncbi:DUF5825 family protein [Streptomyces xanthochromogenes]|uniref:Uncharacterized protein n=3 Tax=Streptomyces TaxID=1883 RepID=A0ABQ3AA45_9ACTN|nr:DUF5825 family protein [Streptomyces xanthochromogenes]GGY42576.1 hypothetical protein GCM10010326_40970 [Streptomyces xanthochromogenes]
MSTALTTTTEALGVAVWRDYDPEACTLPGMYLGEMELTGPPAEESDRLWKLGARRVRLPEPVDLADLAAPGAAERAVRALSLVRDLTARAVLVEWKLRLDPAAPDDTWRTLSHLQPPQRLEGPADATADLRRWRDGHYLCKCLWRQGPGFVQIRDRRWGDLRRFTAEEPEYHRTIEALAYGAPAASVPAAVLADFLGERLVLAVGELAWWMPYRVNRWIQEAMAI